MRTLLKAIRRAVPVNTVLRVLLRGVNSVTGKMILRWPVSGVTSLKFGNLPFKMYSRGDDHIVNSFYYKRNYQEHKDLDFFLHLVKRATVVLDIGANTGLYSILSGKTNPGATVYSFEPYPVNVTRLRKNTEINETRNEIIPKALGDVQSVINFTVPANGSISDTSSASAEFSQHTYEGQIKWKSIEVEQTTLDTFITEKNIRQVDLMKVDVEGHEEAVFRGAAVFFQKFSPVIQCEILLDEQRKLFFGNFIRQNGYTAYLILNDGLLRLDGEMQHNPASLNYLFAKRKTAKQFSSFAEMETLLDEIAGK